MKKFLRAAAVLALVLTMVLSMAAPAAAITLPEKGNITVSVIRNGSGVYGVEVTLYKVADCHIEENNLSFRLVEKLKDSAVELNGLNAEQQREATSILIDKLYELSEEEREALIIDRKRSLDDGVIKFENLERGVYLVRKTSSDRYSFDPMLIYMPYTNPEGDGWMSDVSVNPKVSYRPPQKDPETEDDPPPPPIGEEDVPPPIGPNTPGILPQTGLLQWPVPVLTMAGIILLTSGVILERKRKREE